MGNLNHALKHIFTSAGGATSNSSSAVLYTFKQTYTAAQVKLWNSVPPEFVAAPGVNKYIAPVIGTILLHRATGTAYNFAATLFYIGYNTSALIPLIEFDSSATLQQTATKDDNGADQSSGPQVGTYLNQNFGIKTAQDSTAGVGSGSVTITFNYYIIDIS